jgi:hypothetical protein
MIRTGQMMFAESIKRHVSGKNLLLLDRYSEDIFRRIILLFLDSEIKAEKSPFSIQQITLTASEEFLLLPGKWHKASTISWALDSLNRKYKEIDPFRETKDLEFLIFQEGCIFLDLVYQKARGSFTNLCEKCSEVYAELEKNEKIAGSFINLR